MQLQNDAGIVYRGTSGGAKAKKPQGNMVGHEAGEGQGDQGGVTPHTPCRYGSEGDYSLPAGACYLLKNCLVIKIWD